MPHDSSGTRPSVLAVVVTWRARDSILPCVRSLLAQDAEVALRVLVVDNASDDGTIATLRGELPGIEVLTLPANAGFAGGVAAATERADTDFVLLLNDDARLEPDALGHLLAACTEGDVAAATATILLEGRFRRSPTALPGALTDGSVWAVPDPEGVVLANSTGNRIDRWGRGSDRDWLARRDEIGSGTDVFGFCGGAALLRTSALHSVGGVDPGLFLYYEDTDLSWRLRAAGWVIRWSPPAIAWHRHASSSGIESPTFRYYNTRNSLRITARYLPAHTVPVAWLRATAAALRATLARDPLGPARWRALVHAASALPRDLRQRRIWLERARSAAWRYLDA